MSELVFCVICIGSGFALGFLAARAHYKPEFELDAIDSLDLTRDAPHYVGVASDKDGTIWVDSRQVTDSDTFAVTAKPRRVPWSIRKKELEQDARQKRRQREET